MMTRTRTLLIVAVALLASALVMVGISTVQAWGGPGGNGPGSFGSMMGGTRGGMTGGPGMMGGSGMMGGATIGDTAGMMGGMMGGRSRQTTPQGPPISLEKAVQVVQSYVERTGVKDLAVDEVLEFQDNFYAVVNERSTASGAFELLVDKYTGNVFPEYGPNMMWNTKYGMMGGQAAGMMGGMMGGQYATAPSTQPTVSGEQAQKIAQTWLDRYQPGSTTEPPDHFSGYYTLHILKDGKVTGMLSVSAYTGQVWYHNWHGTFVQLKELGQ